MDAATKYLVFWVWLAALAAVVGGAVVGGLAEPAAAGKECFSGSAGEAPHRRPKIIATLTTIPERLEKGLTKRCLDSLRAQTRAPDLILLNVPRRTRKGLTYNLGKLKEIEAAASSVVKINFLDEDDGPITKLTGALRFLQERKQRKQLKHEEDDEDMNLQHLFIVDDDCAYAPDSLETLLEARRRLSAAAGAAGVAGAALGFVSRDARYGNSGELVDLHWTRGMMGASSEHELVPTTFLENYAGALYDARLFEPLDAFLTWVADSVPQHASFADDIIIGRWLQMKGVRPMRVAWTKWPVQHDAASTPELRDFNLAGDNNMATFEALQFDPIPG